MIDEVPVSKLKNCKHLLCSSVVQTRTRPELNFAPEPVPEPPVKSGTGTGTGTRSSKEAERILSKN